MIPLGLMGFCLFPGVTQRKRAGARDQAGPGRHGPAGDHQGDLHHAAVRQPLRGQVLRQLLQEHRPMGEAFRGHNMFSKWTTRSFIS